MRLQPAVPASHPRLMRAKPHRPDMGRKAVDERAVLELERAIRDLVDAAQRRAEAALDRVDGQAQAQALGDLRHAADRVATWRRPSSTARP